MRAVVIVAGRSLALQPLSPNLPPPLLPCVDRPVLQHLVEFLVDQGFTDFDFVLHEAPEQIEQFLGDGKRWGSRFAFHLIREPNFPYFPLKLLQSPDSDSLLLIHADRLPMLAHGLNLAAGKEQNRLYCSKPENDPDGRVQWSGAAWVTPSTATLLRPEMTEQELEPFLQQSGAVQDTTTVRDLLDFRTFDSSLLAQHRMLSDAEAKRHLSASEVEPGVWIARNVVIHPTARLTPPLFIGENSRISKGATIGPNAVIAHDSFIDKDTSVVNSAVHPGSYCGENLELDRVMVDRNRLLDGHLGAPVHISDSFILGALRGAKRNGLRSVISRCLAAVLLLPALPLFLLTSLILYLLRGEPVFYRKRIVRLPASEHSESWEFFHLWSLRNPENPKSDKMLHFLLFDFLTALPQVAMGRLHFVGVQPRSREEIESLPPDWKALYLQAKAGLITEALVVHGSTATSDDIYSSEVYYSAMRSARHDLSLALRFLVRVLSSTSIRSQYGQEEIL